MDNENAVTIRVIGIVQGVGFRPFIYSLANKYSISGWVRNTSGSVELFAQSKPENLQQFISEISTHKPPLAKIDQIEIIPAVVENINTFEIRSSEIQVGEFQPISPDICVCPDCLAEMNDPFNRRYRYPFINCTNCGPRFTIIKDIPYDRPKTTMAGFTMCQACQSEYKNPLDRRFHAQPIACPDCGPQIWLEYEEAGIKYSYSRDDALLQTQDLLRNGKIVAIKGLGGFHLACDALNPAAVHILRQRKLRIEKPFALMCANIEAIQEICEISPEERDLLISRERPIVILRQIVSETRFSSLSPRQKTLGVMLPYTPLHELLFQKHPHSDFAPPMALVMTSANFSEEPIVTDNNAAKEHLESIADAFLLHNRDIHIRCDDSVTRISSTKATKKQFIRRSRGYAPMPISLPWDSTPILGYGAELKNTFCLSKGRYAFVSHHIGDLQNYETFLAFSTGIQHFESLFHTRPSILAHDIHPDYLSTKAALQRSESEGLSLVGIQHHHAHIAACMAENRLPIDEPVIGVALDGTGYGLDGNIWGGEFLLTTYKKFDRCYHFENIPLPGGDSAIRKPARTALAYLWHFGLEWLPELDPVKALCAEDQSIIKTMLVQNINSPKQSSAGRLFDAVSAMLGVCQKINYEGQAAIELEALIDPIEKFSFPIVFDPSNQQIPLGNLISEIYEGVLSNKSPTFLASVFHNYLSLLIVEVIMAMRIKYSVNKVVLSGGVWQNISLFTKTIGLLQNSDFLVYTHQNLPPNDGCISFGQCAVAHHQLAKN